MAQTSASDVCLLVQLLTGWRVSGMTSTKLLLSDQILGALCPNIPTVIYKLVAHNECVLAIALLDVCRPVFCVFSRIHARDLLTNLTTTGEAVGHFDGNVSASDFRSRDDIAWARGLPASLPRIVQTRTVHALFEEFIATRIEWVPTRTGYLFMFLCEDDPRPSFARAFGRSLGLGIRQKLAFPDAQPSTIRGFGRAIGLAILHGADLLFSRLAPPFVSLAHPRMRQGAKDLASIPWCSHVSWRP